jgi:hypothetical protein
MYSYIYSLFGSRLVFRGGGGGSQNVVNKKKKIVKAERALGNGSKGEGTTQLVWGGGGVRGWPSPGGRYTRIPDPGWGHTPPRGEQEDLLVWTRKGGGALIKICIMVVVL